jgi:phage-related protein (TIGR01555 family)
VSDTPEPRRRGNPNWTKGVSGNPTGKRKDAADVPVAQILAQAGVETWRGDGWSNVLTGLGTSSKDKRLGTSFGAGNGITWPEAMAMWREDDLAARVIEVPPNEMLRQGWRLCIGSDRAAKDREEATVTLCDELGLDDKLALGLCYERAYGGGALFLGVRDGRMLTEPVNENAIRGLDWITTIEPRELTPVGWYADPKAPRFGDVAIWRYTPTPPGPNAAGSTASSYSSIDIHESRLATFPGIKVSALQVAQAYGWGASALDRVYAVLRDFASAWAGAGLIAADFAPPVFKMKGLNEVIAQDKGSILRNRLAAIELARGLARVALIDADREEYKRETVNIAGLPELLDKFAARFAAAADMPLTLLMGTSPGGLNATGDSDIRFFYDRMKSAQIKKLLPRLRKVVKYLLLATGGEPDHWSIEFNPLWQPSAKEVADTRQVHATTDAVYLQWGVLTPDEVRDSRFSGDGYGDEVQIDDEDDEYLDPELAAMPAASAAGSVDEGAGVEEQNTYTSAQASTGAPARGPASPVKPGAQVDPTVAPAGLEPAKTAMNGAQVTSLIEIVQAVGRGELPRESAKGILAVAYALAGDDAEAILPPENWKAPAPPPVLAGGAPPPGAGKEPPQPAVSEEGSTPKVEDKPE